MNGRNCAKAEIEIALDNFYITAERSSWFSKLRLQLNPSRSYKWEYITSGDFRHSNFALGPRSDILQTSIHSSEE